MRKVVLIMVLIVSANGAVAQDQASVPESVKKTFDSLYPNTENVKWKMRKGNYEAAFGTGVNDLIVRMDASGNLVETEVATPLSVLPNQIAMYVIENFPGIKIKQASTITTADGKMMYKAEVGELDLFFNSRGEFIRYEEQSDEEGEELKAFGKN